MAGKMIRRLLKGCAVVLLFLVLLVVLQIRPDIAVDKLIREYGGEPSKFMEMDGMRVHYRDEGEGEPVVLLHGAMSSLHTWEGWAEELKEEYRVIRLDLPAFGLTGPNPAGEYGFDYYADFLAEFLDNLGVEKCSVAGNSLGGGVTWAFASRYPGRVNKIILLDAAGFTSEREVTTVADLAGFPLAGFFLRYVTPKYIVAIFVRQVYGDKTRIGGETVTRYYRLLRREGNREVVANLGRTITAFSEAGLRARLALIQAPALIMWGEDDTWIPVSNAHKFHESLTGSRLIVYAGVGHVPMEEIPGQTVRDALKFLREE